MSCKNTNWKVNKELLSSALNNIKKRFEAFSVNKEFGGSQCQTR